MKHSKLLSTSILIASVLLLSGERSARFSSKADPNQSKKSAFEQTDSTHNQEEKIPISVLTTEQTAFDKAIGAIEEQAKAAEKQSDAYKETFYSPSVLIQIGLLFVGVIYSIFAALQWSAIKRQAHLTVTMERPWIMVIPARFEIEPKNAPATSRRVVTIYFKVINAGRTVAWLTGTRGTVEKMPVANLSAIPNYPIDIATTPIPKPPNESFEEFGRRTFEPDEYAALCDGRLDLIIYGLMTYRSALQPSGRIKHMLEYLGVQNARSEHITRFCFSLSKSPMGPLAMSFCGPPLYNRYT